MKSTMNHDSSQPYTVTLQSQYVWLAISSTGIEEEMKREERKKEEGKQKLFFSLFVLFLVPDVDQVGQYRPKDVVETRERRVKDGEERGVEKKGLCDPAGLALAGWQVGRLAGKLMSTGRGKFNMKEANTLGWIRNIEMRS